MKLLFRGIKIKKDTTSIVSPHSVNKVTQQYSRKVNVDGTTKGTGDIPVFLSPKQLTDWDLLCPIFGFKF